MVNFKNLKMGKATSVITVEHRDTERSLESHNDVLATVILLGGYNQFGRKIPLEKWYELRAKRDEVLSEINFYINQ